MNSVWIVREENKKDSETVIKGAYPTENEATWEAMKLRKVVKETGARWLSYAIEEVVVHEPSKKEQSTLTSYSEPASYSVLKVLGADGNSVLIVIKTPKEWWEEQYNTPFNDTNPAWQSFYKGVRKGHRGINLVTYVFEEALDMSRADGFQQRDWEAVAFYAGNYVISK